MRWLDRVLAWVSWAAALLVVVLLFAGPSLIGAKTSKSNYTITSGSGSKGGSSSGSGSSSSSSSSSSSAAGAAVFSSAGCANCHTLKAAGASGTVGPNLDQLQPSADQVRAIVSSGGGGMPSFTSKLSSAQIAAVASYVSSVAGH
ncbi:MAG: c-type cytochrome [Solirubrobacteraceae bacterium]|jgi:cytochrome c553